MQAAARRRLGSSICSGLDMSRKEHPGLFGTLWRYVSSRSSSCNEHNSSLFIHVMISLRGFEADKSCESKGVSTLTVRTVLKPLMNTVFNQTKSDLFRTPLASSGEACCQSGRNRCRFSVTSRQSNKTLVQYPARLTRATTAVPGMKKRVRTRARSSKADMPK